MTPTPVHGPDNTLSLRFLNLFLSSQLGPQFNWRTIVALFFLCWLICADPSHHVRKAVYSPMDYMDPSLETLSAQLVKPFFPKHIIVVAGKHCMGTSHSKLPAWSGVSCSNCKSQPLNAGDLLATEHLKYAMGFCHPGLQASGKFLCNR